MKPFKTMTFATASLIAASLTTGIAAAGDYSSETKKSDVERTATLDSTEQNSAKSAHEFERTPTTAATKQAKHDKHAHGDTQGKQAEQARMTDGRNADVDFDRIEQTDVEPDATDADPVTAWERREGSIDQPVHTAQAVNYLSSNASDAVYGYESPDSNARSTRSDGINDIDGAEGVSGYQTATGEALDTETADRKQAAGKRIATDRSKSSSMMDRRAAEKNAAKSHDDKSHDAKSHDYKADDPDTSSADETESPESMSDRETRPAVEVERN